MAPRNSKPRTLPPPESLGDGKDRNMAAPTASQTFGSSERKQLPSPSGSTQESPMSPVKNGLTTGSEGASSPQGSRDITGSNKGSQQSDMGEYEERAGSKVQAEIYKLDLLPPVIPTPMLPWSERFFR